jgi:DNA polymerase I-like protein with 3'-5' exonuclease and polymerase domains
LEEGTKSDRQLAKALSHGPLYGVGVEGFRRYARSQYRASLSLVAADRHREAYFRAYQGPLAWHRQVRRGQGTESRILAQRRRLVSWDTPETESRKTPVQETGAHGLKRPLALLSEWREKCQGAVTATPCHDGIAVECDEGQAKTAAEWDGRCRSTRRRASLPLCRSGSNHLWR